MVELILQFKDVIMVLLEMFARSGSIFLVSLAMVYIVGRMFELTKSFRVKNFVALVCLYGFSALSTYMMIGFVALAPFLWEVFLYGSYALVLYVLIGFRLFDRIDNLLDKKIGEDQGFPKTRRKKGKK